MANLNEMDRWQIAQEAIKKSNALPRKPGDTKPGVAESITDYLPFRFENPLSAMQKAYTEAGGGAAGVGAALGNRVAAGVTGAVDMAKPDTEPGFISGFKQGLSTPTKPVADNRSVETQNQPPIGRGLNISALPAGGITASGVNTSGRAGFSNRIYRDTNGNVIASGISDTAGRGGFTGADTDEQAAINLKSRLEQDAAAREMAANFDRQTEALRNARAEKMGISRDVLDASEGRGMVKGVQDIAEPNSFALPGDSYGDDIRRRNTLLNVINDPRAKKADRAAALSTFQSFMNQPQPVRPQQTKDNLLDVNRFLLAKQQFDWQQGMDRNKLALDEMKTRGEMSARGLEQRKYTDERRKAFIDNFSYPDEKAPQAQLGALVLQLSDETQGIIPPEIMADYVKKAADEAGVDWKDAPPKSLVALGVQAMKLAKQDMVQ